MKHVKKRYVLPIIATLFGLGSFAANAGNRSIDELFPILANQASVERSAVELIDPAALTLSYDYTVKTYFITEETDFKNSFGWYDAAENPTEAKNTSRIWKEATSKETDKKGKLKLGQLQSIGRQTEGTTLGFYLTSGEFGGKRKQTFYTNESLNSDGISHVIAGLIPDQGILLLGFSDTLGVAGGGFSDLIVAVDIGVQNAGAMSAGAPEPSEWALMIIGSLTLFGVARRRMRLHEQGLVMQA